MEYISRKKIIHKTWLLIIAVILWIFIIFLHIISVFLSWLGMGLLNHNHPSSEIIAIIIFVLMCLLSIISPFIIMSFIYYHRRNNARFGWRYVIYLFQLFSFWLPGLIFDIRNTSADAGVSFSIGVILFIINIVFVIISFFLVLFAEDISPVIQYSELP